MYVEAAGAQDRGVEERSIARGAEEHERRAAPLQRAIELGEHETSTFWVCLTPNLASDVLSGEVCRKLKGTLRVMLHDAEGDLIEEKPIRFTATLGRSKLHVGPSVVRFGRLSAPTPGASPRAVQATLRVANRSEMMPLQWSATVPPALAIGKSHGELLGYGEACLLYTSPSPRD